MIFIVHVMTLEQLPLPLSSMLVFMRVTGLYHLLKRRWNNVFVTQLGQERCIRFLRATECHVVNKVRVLIFFYHCWVRIAAGCGAKFMPGQNFLGARMVDNEFYVPDLQQSCWCESQRKCNTCIIENVNNNDWEQCCEGIRDYLLHYQKPCSIWSSFGCLPVCFTHTVGLYWYLKLNWMKSEIIW